LRVTDHKAPAGTVAAGPRCANCAGMSVSVRYDFGEQQILACQRCGLLFLHPWPDEEATRAVYGESYFENSQFMNGNIEGLFGYVDYVAERFIKQIQYSTIAREIAGHLADRPGRPRLLEVGCGFGYFLDVAFEENFDVMGLEFNPYAVERLQRKYAFPVKCGALEIAELEPASVEAAVLFDVIEHLRDPFAALDRLRDAVVPGGVLVVTTVDAESPVSRLIGKHLEDFRRTREHLFFFSRKTMRSVLERHGFDVISIRSIGHTFDLAFLLDRLTLYNKPLFSALRRLVMKIRLGSIKIYINPGTKMIVYARRRSGA
jgi:SAM-dependent methyltransferase